MLFHTLNTKIYEAHAYALDILVYTVNMTSYIFYLSQFDLLKQNKDTKKRWLLMDDVERVSSFKGCCSHVQDVKLNKE